MTSIPLRGARSAVPVLWGGVVAWLLTRFFFEYAPGAVHLNHEGYSYAYRSLEFVDAVRAGYWSPQWATHFRAGLGGPYFSYYQPGFFYAVAAFATVLSIPKAIAAALWAFALTGYLGVYTLVRGRFGTACGTVGGTALLAASYVVTDLYRRGDLSEFAGTMTFAVALASLVGWLELGGRWRWAALAVGSGLLVVIHPVAGLAGYVMLGVALVTWTALARTIVRPLGAAAALVAGVGLSSFYWMPLWLEWAYVQGENATRHTYELTRNFVSLGALLGLEPGPPFVPMAVRWSILGVAGFACALTVVRRRDAPPPQRRLCAVVAVVAVSSTFLVTEASAGAWAVLPMARMVQFPWRLLMIQTVGLAGLAGCIGGVPRSIAAGLVLVVVWPLLELARPPIHTVEWPATAAGLAGMSFAPDAADEWLPANARRMASGTEPQLPVATEGTVDEFLREPGHLRAQITSPTATLVTLPHYYFPLGWSATLDGVPMRLQFAPPVGLMAVWLPRGGVLDVRFTTTPARRTGLVVSGVTLLLVATIAVSAARRATSAT